MASRGANETDKLRQNVEEQMQRLLSQLEDLEAEKDSLEPEEYKDMYDDTIQQLKEFKTSLEKMMAGNMTLVDQFSNMKMVWLSFLDQVSYAESTSRIDAFFSNFGCLPDYLSLKAARGAMPPTIAILSRLLAFLGDPSSCFSSIPYT